MYEYVPARRRSIILSKLTSFSPMISSIFRLSDYLSVLVSKRMMTIDMDRGVMDCVRGFLCRVSIDYCDVRRTDIRDAKESAVRTKQRVSLKVLNFNASRR